MPVFYSPWGITARDTWRGLENYVPAIAQAGIPGGGGVDVVNYAGRGILMSTNWSPAAAPVIVRVDIDGVTILNAAAPESMAFFIGFTVSLYVRMVSGGVGGPATVVYLRE